jgi:hypothetical protein
MSNKSLEEEKAEVMAQDLSPQMMAKLSTPKKTWFFERMGDGKIFACEEREAWQICFNKSNWKRRDFRLLGTSDGTTFYKIVKESMVEARQLEPEIEKKRTELQRYMDAEEKLIMNEAVDMEGDPEDVINEQNKQKVLRLRKIMDRLHEELDTVEARYREVTASVIKRATDAEMEVAIKNQEAFVADQRARGLDPVLDWPDQNLNIQTPEAKGGGRQKILGLIGNN